MYINLFLFSFILSVLGSWVVIKFGGQIGINDIPNGRSSHTKVIPKGGGIGIIASFVLASLILSVPVNLWLPSLTISLVSLWGGDMHRLSVKKRLFIQFGCSMAFLIFFMHSRQVDISVYFFCVPISVYIVGTSNFYNFMDGIDGLAGITSVVGFLLLVFYSGISGIENVYSMLCFALVFSCLGFLCFNIPKAKVFLGDVGSILLGFLFACLAIVLSESIIDFIIMTGFLAPFYFDELYTMYIRFKNGDSLIIAHRKHTYQVLANELEISHCKISLVYGLAQSIIGLSIIALKPKGIYFILSAYLVYFMGFILVSINIRKKVPIK